MAITWCGLAPHPPIIVPEIGKQRCAEVALTCESMRAWSRDLIASNPDRVVLLSPHTPRPAAGIAYADGLQICGDFGQFGCPQVQHQFTNDTGWLADFASAYPCDLYTKAHGGLDHGALVPLHFLAEAGWQGATVVLGLPIEETAANLEALARAIAQACQDADATALIASGDMSHCLKPGAPGGFDPQGQSFDRAFVEQVQQGAYQQALAIDKSLQQAACQDVVGSCHVAWFATAFASSQHHFYSYEGPFGVGYTVTKFMEVPQ